MTLRDSHMKQINMFHKKILRGFLGLSDRSPISGLYFIFSEIPMEASIHRDVFSLFYSVLANPQSKIHQVVKYLMEEAADNSRTWSKYVQNLAAKYNLPEPLAMFNDNPMSKESFKTLVMTKITAYHENEQRSSASANSKMRYLHVGTRGLNGRPHPVLARATTTSEVKALRPVVKMLVSDYFTFAVKNAQSGGGSHCRLCPASRVLNRHVLK